MSQAQLTCTVKDDDFDLHIQAVKYDVFIVLKRSAYQ